MISSNGAPLEQAARQCEPLRKPIHPKPPCIPIYAGCLRLQKLPIADVTTRVPVITDVSGGLIPVVLKTWRLGARDGPKR